MKYYFILGSNPALSVAELSAVFGLTKSDVKPLILAENQVFTISLEDEIDAQELIRQLGGIIKIGKILASSSKNTADLLSNIKNNLKTTDKKYYFGFSNYSKGLNIKPLAMELKKFFKEQEKSCRWVVSRDPILSSVVVEQNNLVDGGAEFNFFEMGKEILIGQTLTVQPFKELSHRDYGRPARDDHSGMLPPKLAQIMINLGTQPHHNPLLVKERGQITLLDPFCGSGTILTEAMLMGFENLIGSDISKKTVEDTNININWTRNEFQIPNSKFQVYHQSATELSKILKHASIDTIVTEPYLGPQRGQVDIRKIVIELEDLYSKSINEFYKVLKPGGRVVMIWPVFRSKSSGNIMLSKRISGQFKITPSLPAYLKNQFRLSNRDTIIYGRADQKVWREIVVLTK